MSPRRRVKVFSSPGRVAQNTAVSGQSDCIELKQLVTDIQTRLSRLSKGQGETMNFRFRRSLPHTRPSRSPARVEAEALYRLVQAGRDSVNDVRNLITVPPRLEQQVKDLPSAEPAERKRLLAGLRFRRQVLREFDNLVAREQSAGPAEKTETAADLVAASASRP